MRTSAIRIEATRGWVPLRLRDVWQYRGLLYFLAWRDIKVRYKQTTLGLAWAVLQPALTTVILTVTVHRIMNVKTGALPYPVLALSGLLPWGFLQHAMADASNSVVGNANLITKVYFPRIITPTASVLAAIPDFLVSFVLLLIVMAWYHIVPGAAILLLPAFLVMAIVAGLGIGVWFAALSAQFRDFRYVIPFIVQFLFFASPVAWSMTASVTQGERKILGINPLCGVIEGFRWSLVGTRPPLMMLAISAVVSLVLLVTGLFFFRRIERSFADLI